MTAPVTRRLLLAALAFLALTAGHAAEADTCVGDAYAGAHYTVCSLDLDHADVRVFWQIPGGGAYGTFGALADDLSARNLDLVFAMNGGMFADDFSPIGLYIEDGKELVPANTADARPGVHPVPNFHKKPNGIFWVAGNTAGVVETGRFLRERPTVDYATQSGPMLVIDGAIHPAFIDGSRDRKRRNGVGVCKGGAVRFAISEGVVNFHDFATFFRDHLGCPNALFLDGGSAPGLFAPELGRNDWPGHGGYGPIVGAVRTAD